MLTREIDDLVAQAKRSPLSQDVWVDVLRLSDRMGKFPEDLDLRYVPRIIQLSKEVQDESLALILAKIRAQIAGVELVHVPAGEFLHPNLHQKQNSTILDRPDFWMARDMVTVASYSRYLLRLGKKDRVWGQPKWWDFQLSRPSNPVIGVEWHQAKTYAKFFGLDLPYLTEWSKAGRGWDGRTYPWGYHNLPLRLEPFLYGNGVVADPNFSFGPYGYSSWEEVDHYLSLPLPQETDSPYGIRGMSGYWPQWVVEDYYYKRRIRSDHRFLSIGSSHALLTPETYFRARDLCEDGLSRGVPEGFRVVYAPHRDSYRWP